MIASSLRRGIFPAAAMAAAALLALSTIVAVRAETPTITTRADTTVDVLTNVLTGSGTSTALGDLTLTAAGTELTADGDIRIVAPAGWSFDTTADVNLSAAESGALRIAGATTGTVRAESANTLTLDVTTASQAGDTLTLSGIRVTPESEATTSGNLGLSLDADANVTNGPNDLADISTLTVGGASVEVGAFDRPIVSIGVTPAVWNGGTVAELESAVSGVGGVSATVFVDGQAVVFVPGAPAFVNAAFNAEFGSQVDAGTIVLVTR